MSDGRSPGARSPGARHRGRSVVRVLGGLAIGAVLALAAGAIWLWTQLEPPDPGSATTQVFEVQPGWGAARITAELEADGLIRDARAFSIWLRLRDLDRGVGEGLYDLSPAMTATEVAERLAAGGRPRTATVLIPEGWRARDVVTRLDALGIADAEAAQATVSDPGELAPSWLPPGAGLEGYLFPDTYELRLDVGAEVALATPVRAFERRIAPAYAERVEQAGLSLHGWTILASMVQAEAAGPEEMPIIAGVFLNRLDLGMPLQSDPTVAYGLDKRLPELSAIDGDMQVDHAWNTYTRPGLPFGPIGNPGLDALEAVLTPDRTRADGRSWLYFLHGVDDGVPVFRPNVDLAAHERDIDRFLR